MATETKNLISAGSAEARIVPIQVAAPERTLSPDIEASLQVGLIFALIMVAVWTPPGRLSTIVSLFATICVLWFSLRGPYSARELGLTRPGSGALVMLASGAVVVFAVVLVGWALHSFGPAQPVPWHRAWQYAFWALEQEFILQSFFFVRLESLLGSRRAVLAAALLFSVVHIPSLGLTPLSFVGGLFFCEMFRRYRNIFPLGLIHATLGLTIAASLPDTWLHHMRVGLGYVVFRP